MKLYLPGILFLIFCTAFTLKAQATTASNQNNTELENTFSNYAQMYDIPVDLLKSVAYTETRMMQIIPNENDDANCTNMPKAYGIMGLRDDDWFGHSLVEGANLIGASVDQVKNDARSNIQAAAALLSKYAYELNVIDRNDVNSWRSVLEKYSGIPQEDIKPFYSFDVFKVLNEGTKINGVTINGHNEIDMSQFGEDVNPKNKLKNIEKIDGSQSPLRVQSTDYPPAVWDPSPNYTANSIAQKFLVVHDTEGPFAGSVSWLKNPAASASSHYIIRSSDGYIKQLVREKDRAWHVRSWNNVMLGVEHEGYVSNPAYFTEAMYQSSAALFRHFVDTYGVPVDSFRIIGHYQHLKTWWVNWINNTWNVNNPGYKVNPLDNTHTDPGKYWNWAHFFNLITSGASAPTVTAHSPETVADSIWAGTPIKISFDQSMLPTQTDSAFKISPEVSGAFSWENNNQTLVFTPTAFFTHSTNYLVTIDTSAISVLNKQLETSYSFNLSTKPAIDLKISNSYPGPGQKNISKTVKVIISFNIPLIKTTLGGRIEIHDSTGKTVSYKNPTYEEINNKGYITYVPFKDLDSEANYQLVFKKDIQCVNNSSLVSDTIISFTTAPDNFEMGTVVDGFLNTTNWISPILNTNSSNLDTNITMFKYSGSEKITGNGSGKLSYAFNDTVGMCYIQASPNISLGTDSASKFGIWVYGDLSYNQLIFKFEDNFNNGKLINSDTLDWTGWKFIEFPLSTINLSGEIFLNSVIIKNTNTAVGDPVRIYSGTIFIDGIQVYNYNPTTQVNDKKPYAVNDYKLFQNYPNPFNPSTTIQYQIPKDGFVSLKVYNLIGQEVANLVNRFEKAGRYKVSFDVSSITGGLSSGIYFYTLRSGNFNKTNKFVLLK